MEKNDVGIVKKVMEDKRRHIQQINDLLFQYATHLKKCFLVKPADSQFKKKSCFPQLKGDLSA